MKTFLRLILALSLVSTGIADHHETKYPSLDEVLKLVGEHLTGATDDTINDAAVAGLLERLQPHVQLNPESPDAEGDLPLIVLTNRFNRDFGYLRIANVEEGLQSAALKSIRSLVNEAPLRGIVFDLRFAAGSRIYDCY